MRWGPENLRAATRPAKGQPADPIVQAAAVEEDEEDNGRLI